MDESFLGRIQPTASWLAQSAPTHHDGQVSEHGVGVPTRQEVQFKDGERIWLRRVMVGGLPHMYLRDLGEPAEGARIDLRDYIADVETELPITSTRDVVGYISLSLKLRYPTRDQFLFAVASKGRPA